MNVLAPNSAIQWPDLSCVCASTHFWYTAVQLKQDCGLTIAQYGLLSG